MMDFKVQKRKGIGNVITTLIILIASVVLGAGVIFFGGSLFSTNSQQDSVQVTNTNLWYNSTTQGGTNYYEGAFVVQNTGSTIVPISSVTVRGITVPQSSWYFNTAQATQSNTQAALNFATGLYLPSVNPATATITLKSGAATFTQASGPISLKPGGIAIVYLYNPASLTALDTGNQLTMNLQAGKATAVQSISVQGIN